MGGNNGYLVINRLAAIRIVLIVISVNKVDEKEEKGIKTYLRLFKIIYVKCLSSSGCLFASLHGFGLGSGLLGGFLIVSLIPKSGSSLRKITIKVRISRFYEQ